VCLIGETRLKHLCLLPRTHSVSLFPSPLRRRHPHTHSTYRGQGYVNEEGAILFYFSPLERDTLERDSQNNEKFHQSGSDLVFPRLNYFRLDKNEVKINPHFRPPPEGQLGVANEHQADLHKRIKHWKPNMYSVFNKLLYTCKDISDHNRGLNYYDLPMSPQALLEKSRLRICCVFSFGLRLPLKITIHGANRFNSCFVAHSLFFYGLPVHIPSQDFSHIYPRIRVVGINLLKSPQ